MLLKGTAKKQEQHIPLFTAKIFLLKVFRVLLLHSVRAEMPAHLKLLTDLSLFLIAVYLSNSIKMDLVQIAFIILWKSCKSVLLTLLKSFFSKQCYC